MSNKYLLNTYNVMYQALYRTPEMLYFWWGKDEALDLVFSVLSMLYLVVSLSCFRIVVLCSHVLTPRRTKPAVFLQSAFYPIFSAYPPIFSQGPPPTLATLHYMSWLILCSPFSMHLLDLYCVPGLQLHISQGSAKVPSSPQGFVSSFLVLLPPH